MNDQVEEIQEVEEVVEELNPVETKAADGGWRPEEEYEGDPDSWVDAKTFNMRGELMDRIKKQTSQLRGQEKKMEKLEVAVQSLAEQNKKVGEVAYKKAMTDLKDLKKNAHEMSDYEQVVEIDEKISELKDSQKEPDVVDQPEPNAEIISWMDSNDWYKSDTVLRGAADAIADELYNQNKNLPVSDILDMVTDRMKEEFPNKFGKTQRKSTQRTVIEPGEASTKAKTSRKKYTSRSLNPQQREIGNTFVEAGAFKTVQEYVDQLAEIGELDAQKGI